MTKKVKTIGLFILFSFVLACIMVSAFANRGVNSFLIVSISALIAGLLLGKKQDLGRFEKIFWLNSLILILAGIFYTRLYLFPELVNYIGITEMFIMALFSSFVGITVRQYFTYQWQFGIALMIFWISIMAFCGYIFLPYLYFNVYLVKRIQQPLSAFELTVLPQLTSQKYEPKGKVTLLEFWNTHCGVCIKQFKDIEKLHQKFKENSNVEILTINTQDTESPIEIKQFLAERNYKLKFVIDNNNLLSKRLNINTFPWCYLIDKQGNIRLIHRGYMGKDEQLAWNMEREINALLKE
ncbi:MAG: TlpA family protein disulfide reductase [Microscillaceae bacterium]|jgi:thiol-disulfide isomerase/thioredoxin|nr:TlpA family protein disulfide reductase [Microscillaceae bacterium]